MAMNADESIVAGADGVLTDRNDGSNAEVRGRCMGTAVARRVRLDELDRCSSPGTADLIDVSPPPICAPISVLRTCTVVLAAAVAPSASTAPTPSTLAKTAIDRLNLFMNSSLLEIEGADPWRRTIPSRTGLGGVQPVPHRQRVPAATRRWLPPFTPVRIEEAMTAISMPLIRGGADRGCGDRRPAARTSPYPAIPVGARSRSS